jgi:hypothetical protein
MTALVPAATPTPNRKSPKLAWATLAVGGKVAIAVITDKPTAVHRFIILSSSFQGLKFQALPYLRQSGVMPIFGYKV